MNKKYFDSFEFNQALSIGHNSLNDGLEAIKAYTLKYPYDYNAKIYYLKSLINSTQYQKANIIIRQIEKEYKNNKDFNIYEEKVNNVKKLLLIQKLRLLCLEEKYEEFIYLYQETKELNYKIQITPIIYAYVYYNLNKPFNNKKLQDKYLYNQIFNYDENLFLDHIKRHQLEFNDNDDFNNECYFYDNINLDIIINEARKYIPSNTKYSFGWFDNIYYFKYDNCGKNKNRIIDYFEIVTFNNTSKCITAYPIKRTYGFDYVDLNYLNEDLKLVKRKSQIDKFNQKYGNYR